MEAQQNGDYDAYHGTTLQLYLYDENIMYAKVKS